MKGNATATVPISYNAPLLLLWQEGDDTVHLEGFGQHFDGLPWDEFMRRVNYLQTSREERQKESEAHE